LRELAVQRNQLLAIKWRNVCDVYVLNTTHEDAMVEVLGLTGALDKEKPASVIDCNKFKIRIDKLDQMLS
jgi:hypothetical protein